MKNYNKILLALAALFFVTSCALEEMSFMSGPEEGGEVVMTFKPKFEDFESVTKAIGKGERVDELLVQVYENGGSAPICSEVYEKEDWDDIDIPFYYGKKYQVYFWAYDSDLNPYVIGEDGLKDGVSVEYPDGALAYDALEILDAFYAVKDVDLSTNDDTRVNVSLTRPFAQVNLVADKAELLNAKATKVEFEINAANSFVPGAADAISTTGMTFTFKSDNFFQDNEEITAGKVYLGTTYLFVPSSGSLEAKVTLYDSMGNKLKGPSTVTIPLASNQRTNLVFTGVEPAWDDDAMDVPEASDGWIHIETPEQMAAFLLDGPVEGAKVHVCLDINMGGLPQKYHEAIAARTFTDLTLYGGALENGNPTTGGGSHMISNFTAPAFLANATNLTVSDLVLDNFNVAGNSHVGTLVNTLKGSSTFTNVTVSNSSATTSNGAAGGVVGYVVRKSEKDRAENLEVKFDGCSIVGSEAMHIATGTLAEGKFVGLLSGYDNGEILVFTDDCSADYNTTVADYASRYAEGKESTWQSDNDYTTYDGFLGDEKYLRAKVYFGGEDEVTNRFCPKWDGATTVEPLVESNIKLIYSAFDVAKLQKAGHSAVTFKTDVDLGGYKFDPIKSITNLDGENNTIYNLKVDMVHDGTGAAFIQSASGTTTHKDIIFIGADIKNVHNPNIPAPNYGNTNDGGAGNAYAGTLVSHSGGTYTVSNVHVKNGKVYAVCKMGGLVGYVGSTSFTMTDCSVDGYTVENYEPGIPNYYTLPRLYELNLSSVSNMSFITQVFQVGKIPNTAIVNCLQWWYTNGECGGLIGFIKSPSANIDNCSVTNTEINCVGQPNKPVVANVWDKADFKSDEPYRSGVKIFAKGNTDIAGRHVNQFIGDVVSERKEGGTNYNITISDYVVDGNTYFGADASSAYQYNHNYASGKYCEVVGCAYYVGVDVKLFNIDLTHVNDCAGTLTFNPLNGGTVTVTEDVKQGNNMSWVGGSFTDAEYKQKNSGSWLRPSWSYNVDSFFPQYP